MRMLNKHSFFTWTFAKEPLVTALIGIGLYVFLTESALSQPSRTSNLELVKLLLKWGAKADVKNKHGYTALDSAKLAERSGTREAKEITKALEQAIAIQWASGSPSKR